jgi:hypothetical protein
MGDSAKIEFILSFMFNFFAHDDGCETISLGELQTKLALASSCQLFIVSKRERTCVRTWLCNPARRPLR